MKASLSKEVVSDSSDESGSESAGSSSPKRQTSKKGTDNVKSQSKKKSGTAEKTGQSHRPSEPEPANETLSHKERRQDSTHGKEGTVKQSTTPSIPAKPFAPPDGYRPVQKHSAESTDFSKSFSDLTGKQIWHITAPVGVPVKSIQELSLDAVATGQPVLSHKGLEYCLREDQLGAEKTKVLLLPDKHGKTYHRNKLPVAQTFHVEQVVDAPNNATLSSADTESTIQRLSKPLPPKPKHLRMRYKPFGSADDAAGARGSSPEDSEKEEVNFREPEGSRIDRDAKKRKHTDNNEDSKSKAGASVEPGAKGDSPRKKAKKGHAKFNDDTAKTDKEPSQPSVPTPDHESEVRGREKTQSHSTEHKKSKKRTDETSQERRARKEEKKRKIREEENIATG